MLSRIVLSKEWVFVMVSYLKKGTDDEAIYTVSTFTFVCLLAGVGWLRRCRHRRRSVGGEYRDGESAI
jgi:hypothetical protein